MKICKEVISKTSVSVIYMYTYVYIQTINMYINTNVYIKIHRPEYRISKY
jgi:hypothetical protein